MQKPIKYFNTHGAYQYLLYCCLVVKLCPTLWPLGIHSPPGSSAHGISQARILEWVAISFFNSLCLFKGKYQIRSDQISRSVVSDSLQPHESQHTRPPCSSTTPGVHSDSRPSSQWCHPAISSSVIPFSSRPQSLPASESFPMSQLFAWGAKVLEFQL